MYSDAEPNAPQKLLTGAPALARLSTVAEPTQAQAAKWNASGSAAPARTSLRSLKIDTLRVTGWLRAGVWWVVIFVVLGAVAGLAFGTLSKPRFTVTADLLIDPSKLQLVTDDLFSQSSQSEAQLMDVESKLRVLTSGHVLQRVVDTLNLAADPEFVEPPGPFNLDFLFGSSHGPTGEPSLVALRALDERVKARREERSYLVVLSVWTQDSQKSVIIANAIAKAFNEELAQGESDSARQAANALSDRLAQLKDDVSVAEDRVEAFKRSNGLQSNAGELTSTLSMSEFNTKVLDAQARVIDAETHYRELTATGINGTASNVANTSATISALRVQYSTLKQQLDSMSLKYGPRHPTLRATQAEMVAMERQIADELARIVQAAKTEFDQAKAALAALDEQAAGMRTMVFSDREAEVQLRALERDAKAKGAIYEGFLTRAGEATERQRLNSSNVRVVSDPVPPKSRSYPPRTVLLIAIGAFAGLALGAALAAGLGLMRDLRRPRAA
jgi:uncharacterized protein involved in exopolysaccharide biosynthesis